MSSADPVVTFVVPCYKLAHFLGECVDSILAQTYRDFEVLIMDDCSPDETPTVAQSYADPRVRHIRNEPNLGHLRNYNKGIELARGQYLWLISADDRLREPFVLDRFVAALDFHPDASFVFCPAMRFNEQGETGIYGAHGDARRVFRRGEFLRFLAAGNSVSAPAALARKDYYDRIGGFPLDLPFAGDWYIWARFALDGQVLYLPEPMVSYRAHANNMTKGFLGQKTAALVRDELEVLWRVRGDAEKAGDSGAVAHLEQAIEGDYANRALRMVTEDSPYGLSLDDIDRSADAHAPGTPLARRIQSTAAAAAGDGYCDIKDFRTARRCYGQSLRRSFSAKTSIKLVMAALGTPGNQARVLLTKRPGGSRGHRSLQSS